ncbi:MAG TPA: glycosyltransferase [Chloroflexota bacterium]|nr:glycosyltransferase [Chloroflexota bacterium]
MGRTERAPLLCFSHLRWDFVWQRPQHVMSRLARSRPVYFIEEPVFRDEAGAAPHGGVLELHERDGVVVVQPVCRDPGPGPEGVRALDTMYARLVEQLVAERELRRFTAWFYTPMLLPAISRLSPEVVVYDAMDELALFKGAPPELLPRERRLLAMADVVFTGGVSLGRAKAKLHQNVHAYPSGVEVEHYGQALEPGLAVPPELAAIPGPRIGFFGVLDERLDLELLQGLATQHPEWQFVLVGPVRKIDPAELPAGPNLHYLGQKQYRELPGYVKGFDVCMMPFALNEATRFISPTKTLEYMAAHKPIVSTPVTDVVGLYGSVVQIGGDVNAFSTAIEKALRETDTERAARVAREREILAKSTWDAIVARMEEHIERAELVTRLRRLSPQRVPAVAAVVEVDAAGD